MSTLSFPFVRRFFFTALAFILAGCSTVKSRIEEKSATFHSLSPDQQSRIKQGLVDLGFTEDMVYMAMGKPDDIREKTSTSGHETTWVYKTYYQQYEGTRFVGYRRSVYYDDRVKAYRVYFEPVHQAVYTERVDEVARVIFNAGQVTAIEQVKN